MIGKKLTNTFNQMERMLHTLEESTTLHANKTKVFSTHEQDNTKYPARTNKKLPMRLHVLHLKGLCL
jgi:hypothetical protein